MAFAGVRAKRGYLEVDSKDKRGRAVKVRQHAVSGLAGKLSGKEMEAEMIKIADEQGVSHDRIRIETYEHGDAPIETGRDRPRFYTTEQYRDNWERAFTTSSEECHLGETRDDSTDQ